MGKINLPAIDCKTRNESGRTEIFDIIRRKYVLLTPEEWVRQHFIHYLINQKNVPQSLIAVEQPLNVNRMKKRADITVFGKRGKELLIVECKAASIKIDQKVFDQIARYNLALKVKYLVVTNGIEHYICRVDFEKNSYIFLEEIPDYEQINQGKSD
jgi:hypothetical protein